MSTKTIPEGYTMPSVLSNKNARLSKRGALKGQWFAIAAMAFGTLGVTFASARSGFGSTQYYASILTSSLLVLLFLGSNRKALHQQVYFLFTIFCVFAFFAGYHAFSYGEAGFDTFAPLRVMSMFLVLLLSFSYSLLDERRFRQGLIIVAVGHMILLSAFNLGGVGFIEVTSRHGRMETEFIGVAVWAELALGAVLCALLSKRFSLIALGVLVGVLTILSTQMRSAGLSGVVALAVFCGMLIPAKSKFFLPYWFTIVISVTFPLVLYWQQVFDFAEQALLVNDRYRGLSSGFSGRLENIADGLNAIWSAPILGHGVLDPVTGNTHNGFIKLAGQFGIPMAALCCCAYLLAGVRAWQNGGAALFACFVAGLLYFMVQPRHISFQLMPLIPILAATRSLVVFRRPVSIRSRKSSVANVRT